ncbi:MAG: hypothetical protein K6T65_02090 [Peptococcaceae bacterium]|nr:hypothetical protein [Peptococcaceae bacterium]
MLIDFFNWGALLSKNNPVAYGFLVMGTMAVMGVCIAVIIDTIFRTFGVNLGYYKKEFEDELQGK